MSSTWGERIKVTLFGESRGQAVGVVLDGLPPGEAICLGECQAEMDRRAPGRSELSTTRRESDTAHVLSGLCGGVTTGAPLCAMIYNEDARQDQPETTRIARPGHADYTAFVKYRGFADKRGGGFFSGRLTAPLVFAGAVARQVLARRGVDVGARIVSIGTAADTRAFEPSRQAIAGLRASELPCGAEAAEAMRREILRAKADGDSVGGVVEAFALGVPPGLGSPFFGSAESVLSALLFSVPGVKGVEFGDGFAVSAKRGSLANDAILAEGGRVSFASNHAGGVLGGITNGAAVVVRVAFKPTPSIALQQQTVDLDTMEPATISTAGRNDPCFVPRAVPVVEACVALSILDLYTNTTMPDLRGNFPSG